MPTITDLGKLIQQKYPGQYDDLSPDEVGRRVQAKFPGAYDDFTAAPPPSPQDQANAALKQQNLSVGPLPKPPLPAALTTPGNWRPSQIGVQPNKSIQTRPTGQFTDAATGRPVDLSHATMGDINPNPAGQGAEQIIGSTTRTPAERGQQIPGGTPPVQNPISTGRRVFGGVNKIVGNELGAIAPVALPAAAATVGTPMVAAGLITGAAAQQGVQHGLEAAGVAPEYAETAGTAAGLATGFTAAKPVAEAASNVAGNFADRLKADPHLQMVKAVKPPNNNPNFMENLKTSMPEVKAAENQLGTVERDPLTGQITQTPKPIDNLDDALKAVDIAKKRSWAQYQSTHPQVASQRLDLSPVADAMEGTITPRMEAQSPGLAASIRQRADFYRSRPFTLQDAEQALKETNADLASYYAKNPVAQRVSKSSNPDTAATNAEGIGLRNSINSYLDTFGKQGGAKFRQKYGTLLELEQALQKRRNVWLRQAPAGLADQAADMVAAGLGTRAIINTLTGNIPGALGDIGVAAAQKGVGRWIKNLNSTDALIRRAFANYPSSAEPWTQPAAMLTQGDIQAGPGPDTSFVQGVPVAPHQAVNLERPMLNPGRAPFTQGTVVPPDIGYSPRGPGAPESRPSRLLPAGSAGPHDFSQPAIITPPPADTSFVRGVPAMVQPPNPARALPPATTRMTPPPGSTATSPVTTASPLVSPMPPSAGIRGVSGAAPADTSGPIRPRVVRLKPKKPSE